MTATAGGAYAEPSAPGTMPEEFPIGPRPYAVTRGRTQPSLYLALELLVVAVIPVHGPQGGYPAQQPADHLPPEHRLVHRLCATPLSVAEVAAHAELPLGVARILIADLIEGGLVHAHAPQHGPDGQPDTRLLERVLGGLRSL
ncbi:DUF742 domain-containing protein [Streptomyces sp. NPDC001594]|uniref:DUF742 domain-containing protein n=1 Tax=Streptomyces sp. NPDC001594 TaxID=3364590 RepID=UPI0036C99DD0